MNGYADTVKVLQDWMVRVEQKPAGASETA
jgi:hypothetical protein